MHDNIVKLAELMHGISRGEDALALAFAGKMPTSSDTLRLGANGSSGTGPAGPG